MFAVKGWNVTAPLKAQVAPPAVKKSKSDSAKSSKKRKRAAGFDGADGRTEKLNGDTFQSPSENLNKGTSREGRKDTSELESHRGAGIQTSTSTAAVSNQDEKAGTEDSEAAGKRKKRKRNKKKPKEDEDGDQSRPLDEASNSHKESTVSNSLSIATPPPAPSNLTPLQSAMRQKLVSSRFRFLNEALYTTASSESLELFRTNPNFFTEYHEGFARQVNSWPENPVNGFAALVVARGLTSSKGYTPGKLKGMDTDAAKLKTSADKISKTQSGQNMGTAEPLPRDPKSRDTTVIDLGCGTGALATQLQPFKDPLRLKLHSFDLASPNDLVTVADIRNLPLPEASVDIAIFSLALMGTNWIEFVEEAWRVLKWKGECWVADVNSRFAGQASRGKVVNHSVGARVKNQNNDKSSKPDLHSDNIEEDGLVEEEGAQKKHGTNVSAFVAVLRRRGFALIGEPDVSNKMFARMRFAKSLSPVKGKCSRGRDKKSGPNGKKFIDKSHPVDEMSVEEEAKVLKPCVYKAR